MILNPQQVQTLIQNAPPGVTSDQIVNSLVARGHVIQGVNDGSLQPGPAAMPSETPQLHDTGSFLGNVANSAGNFVKGIGQVVAHPIQTVETLGKTGLGAAEEAVSGVTGMPHVQDANTQAYHQTLDYFKQRYGSVDNFLKTAYQDPVGTAADASVLFTGVGGALKSLSGEAGQLGMAAARGADFVAGAEGVTKVAGMEGNLATRAAQAGGTLSQVGNTLNPVEQGIKAVGAVTSKFIPALQDIGGKLANYGTSQATGLNPETIRTVMDNPDQFSKEIAATYSREGIASEVENAINQRIGELSATGKEYGTLRATPGAVNFTENPIPSILKDFGISVNKEGQIIHDINSIPLSTGDLRSLQTLVDKYGMQNGDWRTSYTNQGFLNTRQYLDHMVDYNSQSKTVMDALSGKIRAAFDTEGKNQITGLKELDAKYAEEVTFLKKVKKEYFNGDGTLKDGAPSKIANAANKERVMTRLEQLTPGIGMKIKVQAALEDIQKAGGQKVGTYARHGMEIFGATTGHLGLLAAAILTSPNLAVKILRGFGKMNGLGESEIAQIIKANGLTSIKGVKKVILPTARAGAVTARQ